ncbi:MAG: DUF4476 domain-containing protein [Verrucomicrobia bacterium]|nr:DUF4476 domain-containing protein [Verrucomicrobiota bacterium]MBS0636707.1 DUF4476 domain-containing protein [Verrucomicrobiota bacterium]
MKHISLLIVCGLGVVGGIHGGLHATFQELKESMRHSTSSTAVSKAKKYLDEHDVTSEQVKELIESVSFENYKVELATYAYPHVSDKKNYLNTLKNSLYLSSARSVKEHIEQEATRTGNLDDLISFMKYSSSSTAVEKATAYFDKYTVTSREVKEMLQAISFDRDKLVLAKRAYPHVQDKKNYVATIEGELFLSSTHDLKAYIAKIDRLK